MKIGIWLFWLLCFTLAEVDGAAPEALRVEVEGRSREAIVYQADQGGRAAPLVLVFHGHGGTAQRAAKSLRVHEAWPEACTVYLQGIPTPGRLTDPEGKRNGWQHAVGEQEDRDLKFVDLLLQRLKERYPIDDRKVFAMGHSNGGGFTYLLWRERADRFAGFAPSAAVCRQVQQLVSKPAIHVAGRNDQLVRFAAQEQSMAAVRRQLAVKPVGAPWDKQSIRYQTAQGVPWIEWIHGGTHQYPAEATDRIVAFFREVCDGVDPPESPDDGHSKPWPLDTWTRVPERFPTEEGIAEGVEAFFYEGLPYQGKPTRVFAYMGYPAEAHQELGRRWPAMVLLHGGGGTAFDLWVKRWNERGYAAIAIDLCGCIPVGTYGNWKRHPWAGPPGWDASFDQIDQPIEDQWTYHAVGAAILGHNLLRGDPKIDPDRTGVTGISWGGYLTSIVAGVDPRYQLAVPVYGCGYLGENSAWRDRFQQMGPEKSTRWLDQWDPSVYLSRAKMPMLWVNGTNDFAYPMDSWQKSYRLPGGPRTLALRIRMPHGHGEAGEGPEEIRVFADQWLRGGAPLGRWIDQGMEGRTAWGRFQSDVAIERVELAYTCDSGPWQERRWEAVEGRLDQERTRVEVEVPEGATVGYWNLFDSRQCVSSSQHWMIDPKEDRQP
jgi:dienelactone hydrolase